MAGPSISISTPKLGASSNLTIQDINGTASVQQGQADFSLNGLNIGTSKAGNVSTTTSTTQAGEIEMLDLSSEAKTTNINSVSQNNSQTSPVNSSTTSSPSQNTNMNANQTLNQEPSKNMNINNNGSGASPNTTTPSNMNVNSNNINATDMGLNTNGAMENSKKQNNSSNSVNTTSNSNMNNNSQNNTTDISMGEMNMSDFSKENNQDAPTENKESNTSVLNSQSASNNNNVIESYTEDEYNILLQEYKKQYDQEITAYKELLAEAETMLEKAKDSELTEMITMVIDTQKRLIEDDLQRQKTFFLTNYMEEQLEKNYSISKKELQEMTIEEFAKHMSQYDSNIEEMMKSLDDNMTELNQLIEEKTGKKNYEEYQAYIAELEGDVSILNSAIYKTEQLRKNVKYNLLPILEKYQTFEATDVNPKDLDKYIMYTDYGAEISYKQYCKDFGPVSPLSFIKAVKEKGDFFIITGITDIDKVENLYAAITENPELGKIYEYLYINEGESSATKYIENIEDEINSIVGRKHAQEFLDTLTKTEEGSYDYSSFLNHLKTTGKGLGDGIESFFAGIAAWFESSDVYSVSEYESLYILQALQEDKSFMNWLDNNYEISQSIGNMLPSVAVGLLTSPVVGATLMGVSAGGNSYHGALVEGYNTPRALVYGMLSGASEALLERYLGAIPGMSEVKVTSLKMFGKKMLQEGIEEGTQEYVDAFLRAGIFGEDINLEEVTKNAGKSAFYGMIIGGIMNSPSLIISKASQTYVNNQIKNHQVSESEIADFIKQLHPEANNLSNAEIIEQYSTEIRKGIKTEKRNAGEVENLMIETLSTPAGPELTDNIAEIQTDSNNITQQIQDVFEEITDKIISISEIEDILFNESDLALNRLLEFGEPFNPALLQVIGPDKVLIKGVKQDGTIVQTSPDGNSTVYDFSNTKQLSPKERLQNKANYLRALNNYINATDITKNITIQQRIDKINNEISKIDYRYLLNKETFKTITSLGKIYEVNIKEIESELRDSSKIDNIIYEIKVNNFDSVKFGTFDILINFVETLKSKNIMLSPEVQQNVENLLAVKDQYNNKVKEYNQHWKAEINRRKNEFHNIMQTGKQSNSEMLTILEDTLYDKQISSYIGDPTVAKIYHNLYNVKQQHPDFHLQEVQEGISAAYWLPTEKAICFNATKIAMRDKGTLIHETGHALLDLIIGSENVKGWDEISAKARVNVSQSQYTAKYNQTVSENQYESYQQAIKNILKNNNVTSEIEYKNNLYQSYREYLDNISFKELYSSLQEYSTGFTDSFLMKIQWYLKKVFNTQDIQLKKEELSQVLAQINSLQEYAREQDKIIRTTPVFADINSAISDIIGSLFLASVNTNYDQSISAVKDLSGKSISVPYSHATMNGGLYYTKKYNDLHEVIANYNQLKITGQPDSLNLLENIVGKEVIAYLDDIYGRINGLASQKFNSYINMDDIFLRDSTPNMSSENKINIVNNDIVTTKNLASRLIDNQDRIITEFIEKGTTELSKDIFKIKDLSFMDLIFNQPEVLKKLNTDNLVKLFSTKNHTHNQKDISKFNIIENEIMNRVNNGENILSGNPKNYYVDFKGSLLNTFDLTGFSKENIELIYQKILQQWSIFKQSNKDVTALITGKLYVTSIQNFINNYNKGYLTTEKFKILEKIVADNKNTTKYINFEIFKDSIYNLGEEFILKISKYPNMSEKIINLSDNKTAMNILKNLVSTYQTESSYKYNKILEDTINYLYNNQASIHQLENTPVNEIINAALDSSSIAKKNTYSLNQSEFIEQCDNKFAQLLDIGSEEEGMFSFFLGKEKTLSDLKEIYLNKYFHLTLNEAERINQKFSGKIAEDSVILSEIKEILQIEDIDKIKEKYNSNERTVTPLEMLNLQDNLRMDYAKTYCKKIAQFANTIEQYPKETITYQGKDIPVITIDGDFSILIHSTDSKIIVKSKELNENVVSEWLNKSTPQTRLFSGSYIDSTNFMAADLGNNGAYLGFTNMKPEDIEIISTTDIHAQLREFASSSIIAPLYMSSEEMSSYTRRGYNEITKSITPPDYVVLFSDATDIQKENAYNMAKQWEIPILKIKKETIINNQISRQNELLEEFKQTKNLKQIEAVINNFESLSNGLGVNGETDTNILPEQLLKQKEIIEQALGLYIQNNQFNNNSLLELSNILKTELNKYKIANDKTSPYFATKAVLSLEEINNKINILQQRNIFIDSNLASVDAEKTATIYQQVIDELVKQNLLEKPAVVSQQNNKTLELMRQISQITKQSNVNEIENIKKQIINEMILTKENISLEQVDNEIINLLFNDINNNTTKLSEKLENLNTIKQNKETKYSDLTDSVLNVISSDIPNKRDLLYELSIVKQIYMICEDKNLKLNQATIDTIEKKVKLEQKNFFDNVDWSTEVTSKAFLELSVCNMFYKIINVLETKEALEFVTYIEIAKKLKEQYSDYINNDILEPAKQFSYPIIENVADVNKYFTQWGKNVCDRLTIQQKNALQEYSDYMHAGINETLRNQKNGSDSSIVATIDEIMKNSIIPLDTLAYRNMDIAGLAKGLDISNITNLEKALSNMIGLKYTDKAYVSTTVLDWSLNPIQNIFKDASVTLEIKIPKGSKGIYIESLTKRKNEFELLLNRNFSATITDAYIDDKIKKLYIQLTLD